jgi:hypothetical protein
MTRKGSQVCGNAGTGAAVSTALLKTDILVIDWRVYVGA